MSGHLDRDSLVFLALGGAGEIGMNLALYGYGGKWLMVDLGITFADGTLPGIDVLVPDTAFIEQHRDDLVALVLTHAHEDHLGAVPYLWSRLRCPVYATKFTAAVLRRKLAESGLLDEVPLIEFVPGETLSLGPFRCTAIHITHSIPESNSLAIETPLGPFVVPGAKLVDHDTQIGYCYSELGLRYDPRLTGDVTVRVNLSGAGVPDTVEVTKRTWDGVAAAEVESCMRALIEDWSFDADASDQPRTIELHFTLAPGAGIRSVAANVPAPDPATPAAAPR